MKEIIIPEGTTKIEDHWFWGSGIESVTVSASVMEISANAFRNCANLREVIFQEGSQLRTILKGAFYQCSNLVKIALPDGLETIGVGCFSESGLTEVVIPSSVTVIEKDAFSDSKNLKKVSFQERSRLKKIEAECFRDTGI